jgi:hypothetical protein
MFELCSLFLYQEQYNVLMMIMTLVHPIGLVLTVRCEWKNRHCMYTCLYVNKIVTNSRKVA